MKKKTVYPKCKKTISGEHSWIEHMHFDENMPPMPLSHPVCEYCEMIDDTITLKHEEEGERKVAYS